MVVVALKELLSTCKWIEIILITKRKYQGVKEFHMLAHIGCYCKIMVFSPFKVKVTYYHSYRHNK